MPQIDHRRVIARTSIQDAGILLVKAAAKELELSDKKTAQAALKKLDTIAKSLTSTHAPDDDDVAAKLTEMAANLLNCSNPDLKGSVHMQVMKAAKIFDAMSRG